MDRATEDVGIGGERRSSCGLLLWSAEGMAQPLKSAPLLVSEEVEEHGGPASGWGSCTKLRVVVADSGLACALN